MHQGSNAYDQQKGRCRKNFRGVGLGYPAKQRAHQQAATEHNAGDDCYYFESFPGRIYLRYALIRHGGCAQNGQQGQDRNGSHILKQQNGK